MRRAPFSGSRGFTGRAFRLPTTGLVLPVAPGSGGKQVVPGATFRAAFAICSGLAGKTLEKVRFRRAFGRQRPRVADGRVGPAKHGELHGFSVNPSGVPIPGHVAGRAVAFFWAGAAATISGMTCGVLLVGVQEPA
jgi:hypothetical protein